MNEFTGDSRVISSNQVGLHEKLDEVVLKHLQHDLMTYHFEPDQEDSTELGEVPHEEKKGSLDHRTRPFGYQYMYSLLREGKN